jgi:ATP-dependent RNA helicase DHX8/PRP22
MLSADRTFVDGSPHPSSPTNEKPKAVERLEKEGQGDYILLLRLFNLWKYDGFRQDTLKSLRLSTQGMKFVRDIRRQLSACVEKDNNRWTKAKSKDQDQEEEERSRKRHKADQGGNNEEHPLGPKDTSSVRKALAIGFANRLAKRHPKHNGYRTFSDGSVLAQLHPGCAYVKEDDDGLLPSWVIYHELMVTSRPFLSKVCPVEERWIGDILHRIENMDVDRLSGAKSNERASASASGAKGNRLVAGQAGGGANVETKKKAASTIDAARIRYLQRKQQKMKKGK